MNSLNLLVLDDYEGELSRAPGLARLLQHAHVTILDRPLQPEDALLLRAAHVILALRERTPLDRAFFESCPNLELVLQTGGHAYHIDQPAATRQGIVIALGRRVTQPTIVIPELVFTLLLGLVRQIVPLAKGMQEGAWPESVGGSLAGRTMGILGYGRLGKPVARLAEAFGMRVVAWERTPSHTSDPSGVVRLPLDELLAVSDVVTVHLRLSEASRHLLNRETLGKMKPGAFLINTARAPIVEESALFDALRENRLAGAGLDVFWTEPLPPTSPWRTLPHVLLTPHVGWKVRDVFHAFIDIAADQLEDWLGPGLSSREVLNPEAMDKKRKRHGTLVLDQGE